MKNIFEFGVSLQQRAHWTQDIIHKAIITRIGIMEETITDMHLLSIASVYGDYVLTKKFNKREEGAASGADWLWIIAEPGSWFFLLVQAKIINPKTKNCLHMDYKNGEQRERLMQYSRRHGYIPVYCIFSYIDSSLTLRERKLDIDTYREDWACSFISPRSVRDLSLKKLKSQKDILCHSIPWMDPFIMAQKQNTPYGIAVATSLQSERDDVKKFLLFEAKKATETEKVSDDVNFLQAKTDFDNKQIDKLQPIKGIRKHWDDLDTQHGIKAEIPLSVKKWFLEPTCIENNIPLSGASIISTTPIEMITELQPKKTRKKK